MNQKLIYTILLIFISNLSICQQNRYSYKDMVQRISVFQFDKEKMIKKSIRFDSFGNESMAYTSTLERIGKDGKLYKEISSNKRQTDYYHYYWSQLGDSSLLARVNAVEIHDPSLTKEEREKLVEQKILYDTLIYIFNKDGFLIERYYYPGGSRAELRYNDEGKLVSRILYEEGNEFHKIEREYYSDSLNNTQIQWEWFGANYSSEYMRQDFGSRVVEFFISCENDTIVSNKEVTSYFRKNGVLKRRVAIGQEWLSEKKFNKKGDIIREKKEYRLNKDGYKASIQWMRYRYKYDPQGNILKQTVYKKINQEKSFRRDSENIYNYEY